MSKLKLIHLFSGIGAPESALKRLGVDFDIVGFSEIDKYAIQAYKTLNKEAVSLGDIKEVKELPEADLIIYGSPCVDFSVAGKKEGLIDKDGNQTRSGLLLEVERLIKTAKEMNRLPKYLLMENVKNLVGTKFKPDFDRWLNALEEVGYKNYWKVLNAKDFNIPQNRERVFVLSIKDGIDKQYEFPETVELTKRLKDILDKEVEDKYYLKEEAVANFKANNNLNNLINKEVSNTIRVGGRGSLDRHTWDLVAVPKIIVEGNIYPNTGNPQAGRIYNAEGISPALDTCQGGNRMPKVLEPEFRIRKLTPKECWRLMAFSDEEFDKVKAVGISDSQLYKQAGNSIVVAVLEAIFKKLFREG